MLKPDDDPEVNPRGDKAWFGVLTWVQPEGRGRGGRARLVSNDCFLYRLGTDTFGRSVKCGGCTPSSTSLTSSKAVNHRSTRRTSKSSPCPRSNLGRCLSRIMAVVRKSHKKLAWLSNHFSDEPLDSIISTFIASRLEYETAKLFNSHSDEQGDLREDQTLKAPLFQARRGERSVRLHRDERLGIVCRIVSRLSGLFFFF